VRLFSTTYDDEVVLAHFDKEGRYLKSAFSFADVEK